MIPVYVSNGAFITRHNGRDYHLIDKYPRELDCDGVEFLMYCVWRDEVNELRAFLKRTGLSFPVMHMDKQIGEVLSESGLDAKGEALRLFKDDIITALEIGSPKLVLHLWNGPFSDSRFSEALNVLNEMREIAEKEKLILTVENVTCRDNVCLEHLLEIKGLYPSARFTYDTKMAHLHGENELLAREKYISLLVDGSICHLHVNDTKIRPEMDRLPIMHIGQGDVDFESFFKLLKKCAYSGTATVESTSVNPDGSVDLGRLNQSLNAIRQAINS